jgi:hypothetical protein
MGCPLAVGCLHHISYHILKVGDTPWTPQTLLPSTGAPAASAVTTEPASRSPLGPMDTSQCATANIATMERLSLSL